MSAGVAVALAPALGDLPCAWLRLDLAGQVMSLAESLSGLAGQIGRPLRAWLSAHSGALWETLSWPVLHRQGALAEVLLEIRLADGGTHPVLSYWQLEPDSKAYIGLLVPGAHRQTIARELQEARTSLELMPGAVIQMQFQESGELRVPYASSRLLDMMGVTAGWAARSPKRLLQALTRESAEAFKSAAETARKEQRRTLSVILRPRKRPDVAFELSAELPPGGNVWHGIIIDVTSREQMQKELQRRAWTDALTGLYNRDALLAQIQARIEAGRSFALALLDCDRLRRVNDSLGHQAGDELLAMLGSRLAERVRSDAALPADSPAVRFAARLQADEFALVLDGTTCPDAAGDLTMTVMRCVTEPFPVRGLEIAAELGAGVALTTEGLTAEQLLRNAGIALHEAKRLGPARCAVFRAGMHDQVRHTLELETDLRIALRQRGLRAVFQPIVDIESSRCVGLEALARWRHPVRGEVSPGIFIPLAEDTGLIQHLGDYMLELTCDAFSSWLRDGLKVPERVSVNISRAQLTQHDLPARIGQVLHRYGLPPSMLKLEVTESLAMSDDRIGAVLKTLRDMGFALSLDDFGTGHSSLASLHELPVQQVKIDRAFVQKIESSTYCRALVQACLTVAQALELDVVAEGVETRQQADELQRLGCRKAQGWLYYKALEVDQVRELLSAM